MSSIDDYSYIVQFIPFLRRWIGPLPGQAEARAMSWMSIVAGIVLCGLSLFYGFRGETFMGRTLGGDFAGFYVTGKILNEYEPARIYDMDLEIRLQHQPDVGMEESQMLPFAQAPYIGQLFRPFAKLPYRWAYVVWLGFSLIFYLLGLRFLLLVAKLSPERAKTGFLLGLSCMAFVIETWIGGQLSVVGFFLIAAFVYCRSRDRELLAGFVLSLALYKITLVAIPAFMLLCGRRWRSVFGFSAGAGVVASLSLGMVGLDGCTAWFHRLGFFRYLATGPLGALRRTKYLDAGSFFHILLGNTSFAHVLGMTVGAVGVAILAVLWWRAGAWSADAKDQLWAATICGSLVCNVYSPIYDTTLVCVAVALIAGGIQRRSDEDREAFQAWILLLYMVPWLTQSSAEFLRFQPLTLVLSGFAYWAVRLAARSSAARRFPVRRASTSLA